MFAYHDRRQEEGEEPRVTPSGTIQPRINPEPGPRDYVPFLSVPAPSMPCLDAGTSQESGHLLQERQGHALVKQRSDAARPLSAGVSTSSDSGLSARHLPALLGELSFSRSLERLAGFRLPVTLAYLPLPAAGQEPYLRALGQQLEDQGQQADLLAGQALMVLYLGPRLPKQGCRAVEQLLASQINKAQTQLPGKKLMPDSGAGRDLLVGWLHGETDLFCDWQSLALQLADLSLSPLSQHPPAN
ncbi:hypothetical protein ACTL6U_07770 [Rhodovibrionaceae bacterium A322]